MNMHDEERMIADVLSSAHLTAAAPDEARAVLHVARSFADELETVDPEFDRLQFIEATIEHRS